ncbi:MAG: IPExxxVDY family protein [Crocinitomicaceae bacterium]|nr:IPExxxVDY family protein [Crocinitomicaceae bacterium]
MAKQKKYTLTFEQEFDFDMVGICSHHSDYRLAWGINECLTIKLCRCEEDYVVTNKKGEAVSSHSMYEFADEENRLDYFLVKNKMHGNYLIPEKPSIDYFLFLCDNFAVNISELTKQLKEVKSILGVYPFEPEEIDSAEYLVFR